MRGFQSRTEVAAVWEILEARLRALPAEAVALPEAAGRVLAADVTASLAVPGFDRAAMDGYALRGEETFGCDPYTPLEFAIVGEAFPARPFPGTVEPGQAVRVMTGAPLPAGADAVLQAEAAEEIAEGAAPRLRVREPVPPGRHVGRCGEDVQPGTVVLKAGRVLRPQDVAVLASLGASPVEVVRRPSVALLVTGDELLPCGARPEGFKIVDSNSVMLAALVRRDGGLPSEPLLLADRYETVKEALRSRTEDVILVSGGSSVGLEDHAPRVLAELGELSVHGVALRPASPTGLGFLDGRPVFLLPGNPVSCLCGYDLFASRAVRGLGGRTRELPYRRVRLPLARKIASVVGRVDYVRVVVNAGRVEPLAVSGASILSSTTRADGFVLVPADSEGYAGAEEVEVYLYDQQ
ncbi:MAG TPA: gephyrin-like molybdotransferase Glp [Gemmataceae bacterium]|nr:gephyrin-like molybdotransferase Glp [Gemmataceae bacterium]